MDQTYKVKLTEVDGKLRLTVFDPTGTELQTLIEADETMLQLRIWATIGMEPRGEPIERTIRRLVAWTTGDRKNARRVNSRGDKTKALRIRLPYTAWAKFQQLGRVGMVELANHLPPFQELADYRKLRASRKWRKLFTVTMADLESKDLL
jgi:hypothetical protein